MFFLKRKKSSNISNPNSYPFVTSMMQANTDTKGDMEIDADTRIGVVWRSGVTSGGLSGDVEKDFKAIDAAVQEVQLPTRHDRNAFLRVLNHQATQGMQSKKKQPMFDEVEMCTGGPKYHF